MFWSMITWFASCGGIAGAAFVAAGRPSTGQLIWIPANLLWILWGFCHAQPQTSLMFAVYTALALCGVVRSAKNS